MGDKTSIEWTATVNPDGSVTPGATWNPVTGCSKVSPGCAHCYAEGVANRFWPTQYPAMPPRELTVESVRHGRPREFTDVMTHEDRLAQPLSWRKPRRVFVNSMSDLFHEDVRDEFIDKVFAVMALAPQHTFQILTKRAERMRAYMTADRLMTRLGYWAANTLHQWKDRGRLTSEAIHGAAVAARRMEPPFPLPNVWLGVSVENQRFADERIPLLLQTPAAVRFISAEPLLGPVLLDNGSHSWLTCTSDMTEDKFEALSPREQGDHSCCESFDEQGSHFHGIDWVIVGGESGGRARPFDCSWARSIVQQCQAAAIPVFVKQLGKWPSQEGQPSGVRWMQLVEKDNSPSGWWAPFTGGTNSKHGDLADFPADLRIREFPEG